MKKNCNPWCRSTLVSAFVSLQQHQTTRTWQPSQLLTLNFAESPVEAAIGQIPAIARYIGKTIQSEESHSLHYITPKKWEIANHSLGISWEHNFLIWSICNRHTTEYHHHQYHLHTNRISWWMHSGTFHLLIPKRQLRYYADNWSTAFGTSQ